MSIPDGLVRVFRRNKGEHPAKWAVRAPIGGLEYGHAAMVTIAKPTLIVRRENWKPGVKGTHAWVTGFLVDWNNWAPNGKPRPDIVRQEQYGLPVGLTEIPMQYNLDEGRFEPEGLDDDLKFVRVGPGGTMFGYV